MTVFYRFIFNSVVPRTQLISNEQNRIRFNLVIKQPFTKKKKKKKGELMETNSKVIDHRTRDRMEYVK